MLDKFDLMAAAKFHNLTDDRFLQKLGQVLRLRIFYKFFEIFEDSSGLEHILQAGLEIGWNISLYLSLPIKSYQQVGRY